VNCGKYTDQTYGSMGTGMSTKNLICLGQNAMVLEAVPGQIKHGGRGCQKGGEM